MIAPHEPRLDEPPVGTAAVGARDATVALRSPTEAPGPCGAAAIARDRIGLPEREGVGER